MCLLCSRRDLDLYIESQRKLEALAEKFEAVYPCQHSCPVAPDCIEKTAGCRSPEGEKPAWGACPGHALLHLQDAETFLFQQAGILPQQLLHCLVKLLFVHEQTEHSASPASG